MLTRGKLVGMFSNFEGPTMNIDRPVNKQPSIITSLFYILLGTYCVSQAPIM
jgi:hypothetical protein